jgi:site-specific recombinase XerD
MLKQTRWKKFYLLIPQLHQVKWRWMMIQRDVLLVELDWRTGLRRVELSNLEMRDIHSDFLVVRSGKGQKDRLVPLVSAIAEKLHEFTKDMKPNEKVFKLNPVSLGMKIKDFAKRAELDDFHCHSLRHKFATDLLVHSSLDIILI